MHRAQALLTGAWVSGIMLCGIMPSGAALSSTEPAAPHFSGAHALEYTRRVVAFGPRPPASPAMQRLQAYIISELKFRKCEIIQDDFTARTPIGAVAMKNLIARFPGKSGKGVAITGHYDTKSMPGEVFVGANDAGSSTGFLLEMARALAYTAHKDDIYLVWFDGEEAYGQWTATNSLYGSRHLAERWSSDGTLAKIKALINVDMIGDKDLGIVQEFNSSAGLRKLVWDTAVRLGYGKYFLALGGAIEDDHLPFLAKGANALDLIDFSYGPDHSWWHTPQDTMDKLSPESFKVVGTVLLEVLRKLE